MSKSEIISKTSEYFSEKITEHGTTPLGVDWNSVSSQQTRFDQVLKIIDMKSSFSVNDVGCGYGQFYDYLVKKEFVDFKYFGVDISKEMIDAANLIHNDKSSVKFLRVKSLLEMPLSDFSLASGVFNMKLEVSNEKWKEYIIESIHDINDRSSKGFSFNMLTSYSDSDKMRDDLYYGDPCFFFDYCKRHFSKNVALLHDYNLHDFTILINK